MKHGTALFFRFLAIFVVVFCGITAIIPQRAEKDDDFAFPIWSDVDTKNDKDITAAFKKGIIIGGKNGEYGKNVPLSAAEAAYAAVRITEINDNADHKYLYYNRDSGAEYIKTAEKYKLWDDGMPNPTESVSKEQFSALLARTGKTGKEVNDADNFNPDAYTYKKELENMYRCGILLEASASESFSEEKITREEAARLIAVYFDEERRVKIKMPDYNALQLQLTEKMSGWQGDWSLYFEDCKTGCKFSINSHQVYSASLIKLYVAQAIYQKSAEGSLTITSKVSEEMRKMITYSDNDAWKYLAKTLGGGSYSKGMAVTTEIAQASGFADTGQFYKGSHKNYNFTSVDDCGAYLHGILEGTIVNKETSDSILSLLKQQQHRQKIPSGVPESIVTANKTGELDYVQGDAAVVYAPSGTYILVIIGDSLENSYGQISKFTDLSETVYKYLN